MPTPSDKDFDDDFDDDETTDAPLDTAEPRREAGLSASRSGAATVAELPDQRGSTSIAGAGSGRAGAPSPAGPCHGVPRPSTRGHQFACAGLRRALGGKAPERGCSRRSSCMWDAKDKSAWGMR